MRALPTILASLVLATISLLFSPRAGGQEAVPAASPPATVAAAPAGPAKPPLGPEVRIGQLISGQALGRQYGDALPSLLKHLREETTLNVVPEPVILTSFEDERLFELPFVYANYADRADWTFTEIERANLKGYL
jgi:hypothetical protein